LVSRWRHRYAGRELYLGLALAIVAVLIGSGVVLRFAPGSPMARAQSPRFVGGASASVTDAPAPSGSAVASSAQPSYPPLLLRPGPVRVPTTGFWSWALLDMRTGTINGSANLSARSTTASMIKIWLASDYLRRATEAGTTPDADRLELLSTMIRDSDNDAAWTMWHELGEAATIQRLIATCALTESRAGSRWSVTELSARDAARMGHCVANGRAAGPTWTNWVLNEMRLVRGEGDFGIRKALPAAIATKTAIKNGWIVREEEANWHLNCLAIGEGWVLTILQRYPQNLGFAHGKAICQSITSQLLRSNT
jgi:hypothetical protein